MINLNLAKQLKTQYTNGIPFPHIVIDNFINDDIFLSNVLEDVKNYEGWGYDHLTGKHQVNKFFSPWCLDNIKDMPASVLSVLEYFNSYEFLMFLEELTGIPNLIADPTYAGGGIHKIFRDGKLSVHADYSLHPDFPHLHRRLNLLIYLNKNWEKEWGGSLQLYDMTTKSLFHDILPVFNRAVIFSTTTDALHGHPHSLACPENEARYSFALYYFTLEKPEKGAGTNLSATWYEVNS